MHKSILLFLITSISLLPQTATDFIREARYYFEDENYSKAIENYDKAITLDSTSAFLYYERGRAYNLSFAADIKLQEFSAKRDFDKALELNPNLAKAYFERGCIGWKLFNQDYTTTIHYLSSAANLDERINDFSKAILLEPDFYPSYFGRGVAYYNKLMYEEAIKDFDKALELDPDYASKETINLMKGRSLNGLQKYTEAIKCFDAAMWAHRNSALVQRAYANYFLKNFVQAYKDFDESIKQSGGKGCYNPSPTYYMAIIELELNDFLNAETDFKMLIEKCGLNYAPVWRYYSLVFFKQKKYSNAVWCLLQALDKPLSFNLDSITKVQLLADLGGYYFIANDYTHAVQYFTECLTLNPNLWDVYLYRGVAHSNLNNFASALDDYNKVFQLKSDPGYSIYFNRGYANYKLGDYSGSVTDFSKAIDLYQLPMYYYWRARANIELHDMTTVCDDLKYAIEGNYEDAIQYYEKYCK